MPVVEIINGVECVFPESKEKSFQMFFDELATTLARCVIDGRIPYSYLEELVREQEEEEKKKTY